VAINYQDWLRQAQRDLALARHALESGSYEWACFAAQQSAEKGVKAVLLKTNRSASGNSVSFLLQQLPPTFQVEEVLLRAGKELDKHYIPSRYPSAFPQGAPCDYYTAEEAQRAITHTEHILAFCEALLAEPRRLEKSAHQGGAGIS
jgi:HEPN domain-containing protein